jgi:RNA polymerase sigma-70 factor (ECF subfamily)
MQETQTVDWEAIYLEQASPIYNYFRYRTGDNHAAQDLTAATFEKAWRARAQYRHDRGTVETWLFSIARNVAIDYFRRSRRAQVPIETVHNLASPTSVEDEAQRRFDIAHLRELLADLPEREREIVALKYGAGLTNQAIAGVTGLSESNVGVILHRTVKKLRAEWEAYHA